MATTTATAREMSEAHWAFMRTPPSSTNSDSSGRTAKIDEVPKEWETGSRTCLYMFAPSPQVRDRIEDLLARVEDLLVHQPPDKAFPQPESFFC